MAAKRTPIVHALRKLVDKYDFEQLSDRDLLRRFVEQRDEGAFAALVRRYSSMVLGVGLRVLRQRQDAEDLCQAAFLLLARKARSTAWRESIANWLYRVAYQETILDDELNG